MKHFVWVVGLLIVLAFPSSVYAGQGTNQLGVCLTDSLNGRERKQLAKWIFFAMSAHPEMKPYSNVSATARTENNQLIGRLLTRLLTQDCPNQLKAALEASGGIAIEQAFGLSGQVAMQELMTNKDVTAEMTGFQPYFDEEKLEKTLGN